MDDQRATHPEHPEQPPPRRVTIHDRRKVRPDAPGGQREPAPVRPRGDGDEPEAERMRAAAATDGPPAEPVPPAIPPEEVPAAAPASEGPQPGDDQLSQVRAEAAGYLDDLQRLKAEFDNYRKRIVKEQTGLLERAAGGLILRLLPVLDNFELAVAAAEESRDFERMLKGIEMVFGELKEVLASEGLSAIQAKGRPFDPNYHEAALETAGDGEGEPYVAEELRSGYTFKGRVLRPSMVKVARRSAG